MARHKSDIHEIFEISSRLNVALLDFKKRQKTPSNESNDDIIYREIYSSMKNYLEKISIEINGTYESGFYDSCAVLLRKLIEALIIEIYEGNSIAEKLKDRNGDFVALGEMIHRCLGEVSWNLSRGSRTALQEVKALGDKAAHSRRFRAHKKDIDNLKSGVREAVQELVAIANRKTPTP